MGYSSLDEETDSFWLEGLTARDPLEFEALTGYQVPTDASSVLCDTCGNCTPEIQEMLFMGDNGAAYTRTIKICQNDPNGVIIRAMADTEQPICTYHSSMHKPTGKISQPLRKGREQLCLTAYVLINGVNAYALFDSGSTTDAVSPDFTRVANLSVSILEDPVTLQLGCVGSRSKLNFGTESRMKFASIDDNIYLDVANLDKYDTILGTPFLMRHGISLDFETHEIVIRGKHRITALPEGEGAEMANKPSRK
jgi:hypothetical protein